MRKDSLGSGGILKSELYYLKEYTSSDHLNKEIKEYINYYTID
ncbi:IS3 family transposase [Flavobacterium sp.]